MTEHPIRRWSTWEKLAGGTVLTGALAIVLACGGGPARGPVPSALAPYPSTPAFDESAKFHLEAANDREQRILLTTWFLNGDPRVAQYCSVRPDGTCLQWQFVDDVRSIEQQKHVLPPATMALLKKSFVDLPPSAKPALADVLIVSFRDAAGQWQTRVYDRNNRPPGVSTMYGLTGAPIVP